MGGQPLFSTRSSVICSYKGCSKIIETYFWTSFKNKKDRFIRFHQILVKNIKYIYAKVHLHIPVAQQNNVSILMISKQSSCTAFAYMMFVKHIVEKVTRHVYFLISQVLILIKSPLACFILKYKHFTYIPHITTRYLSKVKVIYDLIYFDVRQYHEWYMYHRVNSGCPHDETFCGSVSIVPNFTYTPYND